MSADSSTCMSALHRDAHQLSTRSHSSSHLRVLATKCRVQAAGIASKTATMTPRRRVKFTAKTTNQVSYVYRGSVPQRAADAKKGEEPLVRVRPKSVQGQRATAKGREATRARTAVTRGGEKRHFLRSYFYNDEAFRAFSTSHSDYTNFGGKEWAKQKENAAGKSSGQPKQAAYMRRRDTRSFHSTYVDHFQGKQGRRVDLRTNVRPVSDVWKWSQEPLPSRSGGMGRTIVIDGNAPCPALRYCLLTVATPTSREEESSSSSARASSASAASTKPNDLSVQTSNLS